MLNMTDIAQLWNFNKRSTAPILAFAQNQTDSEDAKSTKMRQATLAVRRVFNRSTAAPVDLQKPSSVPRRIAKRAMFLHNKLEESRQVNAVIDHHMRAEQGGYDAIASPFELEQLFYQGGSQRPERQNRSFAHRKKSG